jgi:hypothetical protein
LEQADTSHPTNRQLACQAEESSKGLEDKEVLLLHEAYERAIPLWRVGTHEPQLNSAAHDEKRERACGLEDGVAGGKLCVRHGRAVHGRRRSRYLGPTWHQEHRQKSHTHTHTHTHTIQQDAAGSDYPQHIGTSLRFHSFSASVCVCVCTRSRNSRPNSWHS